MLILEFTEGSLLLSLHSHPEHRAICLAGLHLPHTHTVSGLSVISLLAIKNICLSLPEDPHSLLECRNWLSPILIRVLRFCVFLSLRPVWPSLSLGRKLRRKEELQIFLLVHTLSVSAYHLHLRLQHRPCGSTWVSQQENVCECLSVFTVDIQNRINWSGN